MKEDIKRVPRRPTVRQMVSAGVSLNSIHISQVELEDNFYWGTAWIASMVASVVMGIMFIVMNYFVLLPMFE